MIVVGVDAHKRVHVALAVDEAGQEIGQWTGPNHAVGRENSRSHVEGTARVLNAVDPHYTRVRSLILAPGTPIHQEYEAGEFQAMSRLDLTHEIRALVERLEITGRLCFDHFSNPPFLRQDWEGYKFPEEKEEVLSTIDSALEGQQGTMPTQDLGPVIDSRL